jgi:DNA-directed RNA polymerase II subunit RPB1
MHALQDYTSVAEAQEIISVPMQMVTPQSNSVLIALVQDGIVGAYMLSRRDALLTREQTMQLSMAIHYDTTDRDYADAPIRSAPSFADRVARDGGLPMPAILKGTTCAYDGTVKVHGPRWTGKQVVSWMLPPTLHLSKATSGASATKLQDVLDDKVVLVRGGTLVAGRLCKASVGMSAGGIVHTLWKSVGPWAAAKFVSDAQRVLMAWLRRDTVCISIRDCITPCDAAVDTITAEAMAKVAAIAATDVPAEVRVSCCARTDTCYVHTTTLRFRYTTTRHLPCLSTRDCRSRKSAHLRCCKRPCATWARRCSQAWTPAAALRPWSPLGPRATS